MLNYITLVYTWVQTVIFQAAASGRFTQSLSKARVRELRENGMGFDEMREQSHHSWSYLSGDCNIDNRGSLSYQIFSCRPCDKTDPSSCRGALLPPLAVQGGPADTSSCAGERQWEANQRLTTQAAMAFLADFVLAGLAIMLFKGLQRTNRRRVWAQARVRLAAQHRALRLPPPLAARRAPGAVPPGEAGVPADAGGGGGGE